MSQTNNGNPVNPQNPSQATDLTKEFQYLTEDNKIIKLMEMMKNVYFGEITVKKHKGKIAGFDFKGQVLFKLEDYERPPKGNRV
jgi:hypothetical protein